MEQKVIDASSCVAGRLASVVAKEILNGNKIDVVNAEKALISGNPAYVHATYLQKTQRGDPYHGPFYPRRPDMMLRRIIRGMVPYKKPHGRKAMKRLKVHLSEPKELKGRAVKIKQAQSKPEQRYTSVGELAVNLGAKKTW